MTDIVLTLGFTATGGGLANPISMPVPLSGNNALVIDYDTINDPTQAMLLALQSSGLQGFLLTCTIAATLTFKDSGGTTVFEVVLAPNIAYTWHNQSNVTNPIGDDVSFLNVNTAAVGRLRCVFLQDATPAEATVALTGTITTAVESEIVTGGRTIILTLTGAEWAPAGAAFDAQRLAIAAGIVAAESEAAGWNAEVSPAFVPSNVVRTSATQVTVTTPAAGSYVITSDETLTATVPAAATDAAQVMVATPTATITANS